jgi:hypothetical protein
MDVNPNQQPRPNVLRRSVGIALAFSPVALLLISMAVSTQETRRPDFFRIGWMIPGVLVALINFYLTFVRPVLFHLVSRRSRARVPYRRVSGAPVIGTLLIMVGAVMSFGAVGSALIGLSAFVLDTGGAGWFIVSTWRDRSLWDA